MVVVSPSLVEEKVRGVDLLERAYKFLRGDEEVQALLRMSNVMTVERLLYNDHGPVHATIVAGSALHIFDMLVERGFVPTTLQHHTVDDIDEAKLVVLVSAYLHDIGNSVHRSQHELMGALMSDPILDRLLDEVVSDAPVSKRVRIKSEIKHAIYATYPPVKALTLEASSVKVADATDMAEGRARIPYSKGKLDMHSLSALSIKRVELEPGTQRPVRIKVVMTSYAGFFQVEQVLLPKIENSLLADEVEVVPYLIGRDGKLQPLTPIYP